jgi:hypothetical protein
MSGVTMSSPPNERGASAQRSMLCHTGHTTNRQWRAFSSPTSLKACHRQFLQLSPNNLGLPAALLLNDEGVTYATSNRT